MSKFVIKDKVIHEINVEKSRFIAYITPLEKEADFQTFKQSVKQLEKGARHYPYAYQVDQNAKSSDDGEPSGTAGRPLLELINNHQLCNIAIIIVRYFGGVKLGAGRLLRTYVEAANAALLQADKYRVIPSYVYAMCVKSADAARIEYLLLKNECEIVARQYVTDEVNLTVNAPQDLDLTALLNSEVTRQEESNLYRKEE